MKRLEGMFNTLAETLTMLKTKVDKIEEYKSKDSIDKESPTFSDRDAHSILTYSSLANSKGSKGRETCKCESSPSRNTNFIFELMQSNTKIQVYREENDSLKKEIIALTVESDQLKKNMKKL